MTRRGLVIPYFEQPALDFGPVTIHAFGILVAAALLLGFALGRRRSRKQGLDPAAAEEVVWWAVAFGFVGAHLYSVFAYFPGRLRHDPWLVLRFWEDLSSFGGLIAGLVGIWIYFRLRRPGLPSKTKWRHLDAIAFTFPFAWAVGRLGCTVAHDHPGRLTTFPPAISLASEEARRYITEVYTAAGGAEQLPPSAELARLGFHDLGWYEFLYTAVFIVPVFLWLDRRAHSPGFWAGAFLLLYSPVRFGLDFLRVGEPRYFGLTPGQYAVLLLLPAGLLLLARKRPKESAIGRIGKVHET